MKLSTFIKKIDNIEFTMNSEGRVAFFAQSNKNKYDIRLFEHTKSHNYYSVFVNGEQVETPSRVSRNLAGNIAEFFETSISTLNDDVRRSKEASIRITLIASVYIDVIRSAPYNFINRKDVKQFLDNLRALSLCLDNHIGWSGHGDFSELLSTTSYLARRASGILRSIVAINIMQEDSFIKNVDRLAGKGKQLASDRAGVIEYEKYTEEIKGIQETLNDAMNFNSLVTTSLFPSITEESKNEMKLWGQNRSREMQGKISAPKMLFSRYLPTPADVERVSALFKSQLDVTGAELGTVQYDPFDNRLPWRVTFKHNRVGKRFDIYIAKNLETVEFPFCVDHENHTLSDAIYVSMTGFEIDTRI